MTDERKQAEEVTAQQILESKLPKSGDIFPYCQVLDAMEAYAALRVAEATKEMYPKTFVEWANECDYCYDASKDKYVWVVYEYNSTRIDHEFGALDELFEYWKQNISK